LGRKINFSGITPAKHSRSGPNSVSYTWTGQGVTTFREFWARSARAILAKMWAETSPAEPDFFGLVNHATFRELRNGRFSPNLATKRS